MESHSQRAQNKKSLLSAGVLMLSMAALQGPLWRTQQTMARVPVPSGGATLVRADAAVAAVALDDKQQATAEIVGEREVLIRGKELGETRLTVSTRDGQIIRYRLVVQAESARSPLKGFPER
jgi:Flp pilus assembly secretin CpaC